MRFGLRLFLAAALTSSAGACAASSGGSSTAAATPGGAGGTALAQGERPRENDRTDAAEEHIALAMVSATPDEERPHYEAALAESEAAIAEDPRNPLPWLQAGTALLALGEYVRGDSAFDQAETLRPIYALETEVLRERAWINLYNLALPSINAADYEAAIPYFEDANLVYDLRPEVMITLGQIYSSMSRVDEAIENLTRAQNLIEGPRAMEMDSATVASWQEQGADLPLMMAQAYLQGDRYDEAAAAFNEILAREPDNMEVARSLASVYVETDQPDAARDIYRDLLSAPGLTPSDLYQIGIGFYQTEDYGEAGEAFKRAATQAPKDREAAEFWARSLQLMFQDQETAGQEPDAAGLAELERAAEQWIELDPNNQNGYVILAQTVNKAGDQDRARELIAQIEGLAVWVEDLFLTRNPGVGATLSGQVRNKTMEAGQNVTLNLTFFDSGGNAIGTEQATVRLPAVDATQVFDVQVQSTQDIAGYSYSPVG